MQVSREIDSIITNIAGVLPVDSTINILNPVIATGEFPSNLCALKILKELAEKQGRDFNDSHLDSLMPNIARVSSFDMVLWEVVSILSISLQLTDDEESMVRKAAVFCIVKLYFVMGEEKVKPKFALLNSSKIR